MSKYNDDSKFTLGLLALVLIAFLVFCSMRIVPVGHVGIVMSFGRITGTSLDLVRFEDIVLTNIDFSDAYERAIEQKQVAQQDSLKAKYELEKAKIEAEKQIATAQGEAESIRIKGDALKNSPGMALLEAIRKWDGKTPQTLLFGTEVPAVFPLK